MNALKNILKKKIILEIGCNTGVITSQIAKYKPLKIIAIDNNQSHLDNANKIKANFTNKKTIFLKLDFFNEKDLREIKIQFDVIIIRHIFNSFSYEDNKTLIYNLEKKLKKNGKFIIIDFYKKIIYRQLFLSAIKINITDGIKRYVNLKKKNSFIIDYKDIKKYFNNNYIVKIFNIDLFSAHESRLIKIINFIFNCSYTMIVKKR